VLIDKTTIYKCLKHFSVYTEDGLEKCPFPVGKCPFPVGKGHFPKHSSL